MSKEAVSLVQEYVHQGGEVREAFFQAQSERVVEVSKRIALSLVQGGKLMLCGNGSNAADAQHLAAEFVSRFEMERPPLPALALTTDSSVLTAVSNDSGFEHVFSKQVKALGQAGDVLVAISTSGVSPNVIQALTVARDLDMTTVGWGGHTGGDMPALCDYALLVPSQRRSLVQEAHMVLGHLLCRLVDYFLFEAADQLQDPGP